MSRYDDLRVYYTRSSDERMELLEQELRAPLAEVARLTAELKALDSSMAGELYGGRFAELLEILDLAAGNLSEVARRITPMRERARAVGSLADDEVHVFRHDLLTPISNVRGVAGMLAKAEVKDGPGLPPGFTARAQRLAAVLNEIKDILDALTDARGRTA
jgi:hypothetical protein